MPSTFQVRARKEENVEESEEETCAVESLVASTIVELSALSLNSGLILLVELTWDLQ